MKLKEWLDIWLNKYAKNTIKERTYEKYKYIIEKHIDTILGNYDLKKLSTRLLQNFILSKMERGNLKTGKSLSNSTIFLIYNVLNQSIIEANRLGYTNVNNTKNIKLPPKEEKEVIAFEKEEQEKIEKYCLSGKPNYIGIIICLYTGIRIGELLALTYDDVDFEKNLIYINKTTYRLKRNGNIIQVIDKPKTKNSIRVIPIPKQLAILIKNNKKRTQSKYLVTTNKKGIVETRSYQRTFELILKRLGIPYKNFHALRHTFATRAVEIGIDVKSLSEILGHKNPVITLQRYVHSMLSYKVTFINKLGKNLKNY